MSWRGLVIGLLCGLLGLGGGAIVAYAVQPHAHDAGSPRPLPAVSPSVPVDVTSSATYAADIDYPPLDAHLFLNQVHTVKNDLATWTYHVPQGWTAYAVCTNPPGIPCKIPTDAVIPEKKIDQQTQVRFRPADEPLIGGYSLRVKILNNTDFNPAQVVATKVVAFREAYSDHFTVTHRDTSSVKFTYVDGGNHLRYNYFQWFAVAGQANATLEMSVSGRAADRPGLEALFNRFADNATGASS